MPDPDALEQVKREIVVIADLIARQLQLFNQMQAKGQNTERIEVALENLARLYRQRLQARDALKKPARPILKERWPEPQLRDIF